MNLVLALLASLTITNTYASTIGPISYECDVLETPSGTNDSWHLTFYQDYVSFFDNDHDTLAKFTGKTTKLGDAVNRVYRSLDSEDPFRIILGDTNNGSTRANQVYAELYLGKSHRPYIFSCEKSDVQKTKKYIEEVIAE